MPTHFARGSVQPRRRKRCTKISRERFFPLAAIIVALVILCHATDTTCAFRWQTLPNAIYTRGQISTIKTCSYSGKAICSALSQSAKEEETNQNAVSPPQPLPVMEVDVRYNQRSSLIYDPALSRFVVRSDLGKNSNSLAARANGLTPRLKNAFIPEGVSPDYYRFMRWRILQRFINANVHVFGTQSLLLGLGIKERNSLGLSAALNWVLKDALGKITRMVWASKMGRKFDSDAKRWRFRSSILFATGNGLEIMCYVFPQLFLVWATLANCLKQMSMLTSSATRNALYNSFRLDERENIGDITAKGEAQIAVVDLLGIMSGVCVSRFIGAGVTSVLMVWIILQSLEIRCMYGEIRSVVFNILNLDRLWGIVDQVVEQHTGGDLQIPTPDQVAKTERIFFPPTHLARRRVAFGSVGRAKLDPEELGMLLQDVFAGEKFFVVVGENVKDTKKRHRRKRQQTNSQKDLFMVREHCHIVLHKDADNLDIVKSTMTLAYLRKYLAQEAEQNTNNTQYNHDLRTRDCLQHIRKAKAEADRLFPLVIHSLQNSGWFTSRFMFGRVSMRAEWPMDEIKKQKIREDSIQISRDYEAGLLEKENDVAEEHRQQQLPSVSNTTNPVII